MEKEAVKLNLKSLLIAAVALLFLGEMLFQLFVSAPAPQQVQEDGAEFLSAIMGARAISLDSMIVRDGQTADLLKEKGCDVLRVASEYSVKCPPEGFLKDVEATYKITFAIENVTTIKGTMPTYREASITLPFFVPLNQSIELRGTAYVINDSIVDVTPASLYSRNVSIEENATISKVLNITYVYEVPFDERASLEGIVDVKNVVYTNSTLVKAPFVSFVGSGYVIVNSTVDSSEVLSYYPDAFLPNITVEVGEPLNLSTEPRISTLATIDTSVGSFTIRLDGEHKEGETIPIKLDATVSGDVILDYSVSLLGQDS